jgi:hypothetical protein
MKNEKREMKNEKPVRHESFFISHFPLSILHSSPVPWLTDAYWNCSRRRPPETARWAGVRLREFVPPYRLSAAVAAQLSDSAAAWP